MSHQANRRIINAAAERLGLPDDKVIINLEHVRQHDRGTIPLALADAIRQERLKKGDLVLLASVGAGFTVGAVLLRWALDRARVARTFRRGAVSASWENGSAHVRSSQDLSPLAGKLCRGTGADGHVGARGVPAGGATAHA